MGVFLQIIGALVLILILVVVAAALYLRFQVSRIKKMAEMMGGPVAPVRVHLDPAPGYAWNDPAEVERIRTEFALAGFSPAGQFTIREMPMVGMAAFANAEATAYGVITHHPMTGVFVELVRAFDDGRMHTLTTAPEPKPKLPTYPSKTVVRLEGASVADLVRELEFLPANGQLVAHTPEAFPHIFEEAYNREMTWAYTEGPSKDVDPDLIANLIGGEVDPETAALLEKPEPEELLLKRFLETSDLSAAEWEAMRDDVYFIHDEMNDDDLVGMASDGIEDIEEAEEDAYDLIEKVTGTTPRERFRELLRLAKIEDKFKIVGTLDDPVPCDVYRLLV